MELTHYEVRSLSNKESDQISGGNPVIGIVGSLIGIGVAVDKAAEWFISGWNNPK